MKWQATTTEPVVFTTGDKQDDQVTTTRGRLLQRLVGRRARTRAYGTELDASPTRYARVRR
jgi:hypothetical protein